MSCSGSWLQMHRTTMNSVGSQMVSLDTCSSKLQGTGDACRSYICLFRFFRLVLLIDISCIWFLVSSIYLFHVSFTLGPLSIFWSLISVWKLILDSRRALLVSLTMAMLSFNRRWFYDHLCKVHNMRWFHDRCKVLSLTQSFFILVVPCWGLQLVDYPVMIQILHHEL